jgi:TRAP-type mannitol/chloroaromatic compound transport system permease small subunit
MIVVVMVTVVMVVVVIVPGHGQHYKQNTRLYAIIGAMSFMHMTAWADRIDRLTTAIGRAVAWLALVVVVLQFVLVLARYAFGVGSIWLTETVVYAHATLFMLAAAWTLSAGGHVRVDVFYADASPRTKATIDLAGSVLLLLPFAIVLVWLSVPYAARSWAVFERSQEASGLPLVFALKTLIPLFAGLMALQGVAQAIHALAALKRAR